MEPRLRYYDLAEGSGALIQEGSRVMVHFDCKYRGLSVVSTRTARVLGGNRTVAEVNGMQLAMVEGSLQAARLCCWHGYVHFMVGQPNLLAAGGQDCLPDILPLTALNVAWPFCLCLGHAAI